MVHASDAHDVISCRHLAAERCPDCVRALLAAGASIAPRDRAGHTPLGGLHPAPPAAPPAEMLGAKLLLPARCCARGCGEWMGHRMCSAFY